ncbi:MAG TPA: ATP-binding protein, partial [Chloroflexota bacterium]
REFLQTIDEETDHLTELVDGVLDVARAQAGRTRLSLQPLDVEQVVRRSLERMNGTIASREVRLECEPLPLIEADNSRLEQVLLNLLGNAVKYSPAQTPIDISIAAHGSDVQIAVMDRGIGITPSDAARIFEPFYRAQTQAAAAVGGAGLGLAVCRAILDAHGGRIWAAPRDGGGTAVYLTLPTNARQRGD